MPAPLDEVLEAASAVIEAACRAAAGVAVPDRQRQSFTKTNGHFAYSSVNEPAWEQFGAFLAAYASVCEHSIRLGELLVKHAELGRSILPGAFPNDQQPQLRPNAEYIGSSVAATLLVLYFASAKAKELVPASAKEALEQLAKASIRKARAQRLWAPLQGVSLSFGSAELPQGITIRTLTKREVDDLFFDPFIGDGMGQADIADLTTVVVHDYELPLAAPSDPSAVLQRVEALATAMRLVTGGGVRLHSWRDFTLDPFGNHGFAALSPPAAYRMAGPDVTLAEGQLDLLRSTWAAVQRMAASRPNVALALSRFDSAAVGREGPGDRLIDGWIALESLFTPDSNSEITFRASMRIPAYLGGDPQEKLALHETVKKSYGLRSRIVHGAPAMAQLGAQHLKLVDATLDILRRALLRAVTEGGVDPKAIDRGLLGSP